MANRKGGKKTPAAKQTGDDDPKVAAGANELRKMGATFAILAHTLGVSYWRALALGKAYDKKVGHEPQRLVRSAHDLTLHGWTVKDGSSSAKTNRAKLPTSKTASREGKS